MDAATGRPIRGAWVAWRPPPGALIEQILPAAQPGDPGITDSEGRFVLERLPKDLALADTVYAVAPGYGYAARRAGLSELVLALPAASALEVVLDPPPLRAEAHPPVGIRVESLSEDPLAAALCAALPPWGDERERYLLSHLPPGRYRVRVDPQAGGSRTHEVELRAGPTQRLAVSRAPRAELSGSILGPHETISRAELALVDLETFTRYIVETDERGRFRTELPLTPYALFLLDGRSERAIPGEFTPGSELSLEVPPRGQPVEIKLREGDRPLVAQDLGLVRLDARFGDLVALEALPNQPGTYVSILSAGRYALFAGVSLLSELVLPQPSDAPPTVVARGHVELELAWPSELRPDEVVRGTLTLVPAVLKRERPDLYQRFAASSLVFHARAGSALSYPLGRAGVYELSGQTELGPLRGTLELAPGQRTRIPIAGK